MPVIPMDRAIDTLTIARKKFPGAQASLDALCRKFNISLESRNKHGALIDSELLALVYIELTGSKQSTMHLTYYDNFYNAVQPQKNKYAKRSFSANSEEIELHEKMLAKIKNSMWKKSKDII